MIPWQYTDSTNTVVSRTTDNGGMDSCLVTVPEVQAWIAAGNTPLPVTGPTPGELIAKAWATADALCRSAADDNSRARYLAWLIDPATSEAKRSKILAVQTWMDSVWMAYAIYRANPVGEFVPPTTPCPFTFWDVAGTP